MITISLNQKKISINNECSLAVILEEHAELHNYCAVMLNATFVPKSKYAAIILQEFDEIEIVVPMQGG